MKSETLAIDASSPRQILEFGRDIKLAHTVFAIPFAASAFFVGDLAWPTAVQCWLLMLCMVSARSFAMGINRYIDRDIDRVNPRTAQRAIPAGRLHPRAGLALSLASAVAFSLFSLSLSLLAGLLSLPLLLILGFYPMMKRLSWLTHWYLGMCLGFAPVAVSIALQGSVTLPIALLGVGVALWTAGFDIIYALQDYSVDKAQSLRSAPARFGPKTALTISRWSFVGMIMCLIGVGMLNGWGLVYYAGTALIAGVLALEHFVVRAARFDGRSSNINAAFFNANACVSIFYLVTVVVAFQGG